MTPAAVFTLSMRAPGAVSSATADLAAIRRSDLIIDLLAARRLRGSSVRNDPAARLLSALAGDVDAGSGQPVGRGRPAAARQSQREGALPGPAARRRPARAWQPAIRPAAAMGSGAADWVKAAAAAAVVATVAGAATTTGIAVTSLLLRLTRQAGVTARGSSQRGWR